MRYRGRWSRAAVLLVGLWVTGCGLDDSEQIDCRCAPETDLVAFPQCRGVDLEEAIDDGSPLSTRTPDCPSGQLLFLREPTTPEAVLFNVRDTFEGFSPVQYVDQLTEDFLFVPELNGLDLYREVYNPPEGFDPDAPGDPDSLWTRDQERRFVTNLLDREVFQQITVSRWYIAGEDERRVDPDDPLQETYIFDYIIDFIEQPGEDGTPRAFEVRGRMEVDLVTPSNENALWSIRRWQDLRAGLDDQSLTELRGRYAQ